MHPTAIAPRFHNGEKLGNYPCQIVRRVLGTEDYYIARFEDGHEAAVYRYEILATENNWKLIHKMKGT